MSRLVKSTVAALAISFVVGATTALAADYTLSVNTALTTDDPLYKGLESFKANVEQRSAGKLVVRIFSGSQLGKDEEVLDQARGGTGYAVVTDGGRLAAFVKEFGILGAPYLAPGGYEGIRKVVVSPLMDEWAAKLHKSAGLEVLSFNWWQGERHLLTKKPIKVPADLKGLRMRTPGAPVWMETVQAMGATPTPMAWPDVYTGLQSEVIDAVEAQEPAISGSRLYEVTKYLTKTAHFSLITGLVGSAGWFDKLPADLQRILKEEALKAGDQASRATEAALAGYEKQFQEKGLTISAVDVTPFQSATAVVYDKLGYVELRKQVDALIAK
jgi:tripartite ATP-independent transporter DctP family solute receptor